MRASQNPFTATFRLNHREEARMRAETWELLEQQGLTPTQTMRPPLSLTDYSAMLKLPAHLLRAKTALPGRACSGMNPQETIELSEFIKNIRDQYNLTIILIEHHMNLVMGISDRIYCIDFGKMISHGLPDIVANDPHVIEAYLGVEKEEMNA